MIKPVLLKENSSIQNILKKLQKENVNSCIVVTKDKQLLGQINDQDIIKLFLKQVKTEPLAKILNIGYKREFLYKQAIEMVNPSRVFVRKDTPINKVIELFHNEKFNYLPVLDKDDKVIGAITPSSLIKLLKEF